MNRGRGTTEAKSAPPAAAGRQRGRDAEQPGDIPGRGWWDVLWRVKGQIDEDNVPLVAAGLALFGLLSAFPALAAAVALYGLFASPVTISDQIAQLQGLLPAQGVEILGDQLHKLIEQQTNTLSWGAFGGLLIAVWSARKAIAALMTAMNVAYNEREKRGFFRRLGVSIALTMGGLIGFVALVILGVAVPFFIGLLPLGAAAEWILLAARWALIWGIMVLGLSVLYRFAPDRHDAKWQWVSWGAGIAASLWMAASLIFALYVRSFTAFAEGYGALGGFVVILLWFYLSGFAILLGAEINSEMERQTVKDTTAGEPKPMGERNAYSADTVGPSAT